MIVVVYDDEEFEPITVIDLPGLTDRDLERRPHWLVAAPPQLDGVSYLKPDKAVEPRPFKDSIIELHFERFVRDRYGKRQIRWICFTSATALAMKLEPAFLVGQRPAVAMLREQNERLLDFFSRIVLR